MDETPNLTLPYIMAAQAQKHVTHNEAIRALDAIVQLAVLDRDLTAPPGSPADGDRYIPASGATGAWAGKDGQIAAWQDNAWMFYAPQEGWLAWVADEDKLLAWDGSAWGEISSDTNPTPLVGVNTTADITNRLSVSSTNTLLTHEGSDHRVKINKNAVLDTASLLFQTNWSGRAEFGLTGDDDWHVKTSADGTNWNEALVADKDNGAVRFPAGIEHAVARKPLETLIQTPGGAGEVSLWELNTTRSGLPRLAVISSVSGDLLTITTVTADQFFNNTTMQGVSYVRIWNTSKTPDQSAWLRARGTTSELYVKDSADISGWLAGETIQIGEPVGAVNGLNTTDQIVAIDVSQMMQQMIGAVVRQSGMIYSVGITGTGAVGWDNHIGFTPDGSGGSFQAVFTMIDSVSTSGTVIAGATQPSPISGSNLVFIRERTANGGILQGGNARVKAIIV